MDNLLRVPAVGTFAGPRLALGEAASSAFKPSASASSSVLPSSPPRQSSRSLSTSSGPAAGCDSDSRAGSDVSAPIVELLTEQLATTYRRCNSTFKFAHRNPRRLLTLPAEPAQNHGLDNCEADLIMRVHDVLVSTSGRKYEVLDLLGCGTFGQVVKCQDVESREVYACKVVKNTPAYHHQAQTELSILSRLQRESDASAEAHAAGTISSERDVRRLEGSRHIVQFHEYFTWRCHLCIVFELLSINLYDVIKKSRFRGLRLDLVSILMKQLLQTLILLDDVGIVHCDVKPENILLVALNSIDIKLIDFGSACIEGQLMYKYLQSRFYRAPEVLLGLPYDGAVDMWSAGCLAFELFMGLPLLPGVSEFNQVELMVGMLGYPPQWMLEAGAATPKFFIPRATHSPPRVSHSDPSTPVSSPPRNTAATAAAGAAAAPPVTAPQPPPPVATGSGNSPEPLHGLGSPSRVEGSVETDSEYVPQPPNSVNFVLKSRAQFCSDAKIPMYRTKKYFTYAKMDDIVMNHRYNTPDIDREMASRRCFVDFLQGILQFDPSERLTPRQAAQHPFITGSGTIPYVPREDPECTAKRRNTVMRARGIVRHGDPARIAGAGAGGWAPHAAVPPPPPPTATATPDRILPARNNNPAARWTGPQQQRAGQIPPTIPVSGVPIRRAFSSEQATEYATAPPQAAWWPPGAPGVPVAASQKSTALLGRGPPMMLHHPPMMPGQYPPAAAAAPPPPQGQMQAQYANGQRRPRFWSTADPPAAAPQTPVMFGMMPAGMSAPGGTPIFMPTLPSVPGVGPMPPMTAMAGLPAMPGMPGVPGMPVMVPMGAPLGYMPYGMPMMASAPMPPAGHQRQRSISFPLDLSKPESQQEEEPLPPPTRSRRRGSRSGRRRSRARNRGRTAEQLGEQLAAGASDDDDDSPAVTGNGHASPPAVTNAAAGAASHPPVTFLGVGLTPPAGATRTSTPE